MDRDRSGAIDFDEFLISIRVKIYSNILGLIESNKKSNCRLSIS